MALIQKSADRVGANIAGAAGNQKLHIKRPSVCRLIGNLSDLKGRKPSDLKGRKRGACGPLLIKAQSVNCAVLEVNPGSATGAQIKELPVIELSTKAYKRGWTRRLWGGPGELNCLHARHVATQLFANELDRVVADLCINRNERFIIDRVTACHATANDFSV